MSYPLLIKEKEVFIMSDMRYALIPAYNPDDKLIEITHEHVKYGFNIVVVDDGSDETCNDIFTEIIACADVLHHRTNRGKGAALRTGLDYIAQKNSGLADTNGYVVVTLDADGQHYMNDVLRVTEKSEENRDALVLGARGFDNDVPIKSRLGNDITRHVFFFVTGVKVWDTQTGLRAFSDKHIDFMRQIEGDRYEYEINVLLEYVGKKIKIMEVPIQTIYLDDNKSSHFNAVRDSFLIYARILKHINIRMERRGAGW